MSIAACAEIVARGDPDRFLAAMSAHVPARALLFPIYAFNVEVARAPWISSEPLIGEMRLQWWRDVLEELRSGAPPRAHEVVTPLAEVARAGHLPFDVLDRLVVAHRVHIDGPGFDAIEDLERFLEETGAGLMWASARALGASAGFEPTVRAYGWGAALASYFRAIPSLEERGRRPLPDGRPEAVKALAERGLAHLAKARNAGLPRAVKPALRAGWRAELTLRRAASAPGRVAAGALGESEFRRRAGLLRRVLTGAV
ncbi:MAG: squalene/phytoene synthase family protein [Pseudomonadota bacterium]